MVDIVCSDEVHKLVDEGILDEYNDIYTIQDLARAILAHRCNPRCLRRVGDKDGTENFKCRNPNNLKISPDNTKHCFVPMPNNHSSECVETLVKIGLAEPVTYNEKGYPSPFKSNNAFFHPTRHIPPTNPQDDLNIPLLREKHFLHVDQCKMYNL